MLPDIGASELLIIAVVALVVVGPKDLPMLMRKVGQFVARLRGMAAEFRASFDEMARQSELDELRREVEAMRAGRLPATAEEPMRSAISDIERSLAETGAQLHPPMSHQIEAPPSPPLSIEKAPDPAAEAEPAPKAARKPRAGKAAPATVAAPAEAVAAAKTRKPRAPKKTDA